MTYSGPAQATAVAGQRSSPKAQWSSPPPSRPSTSSRWQAGRRLWPAAAVLALGVTLAACSGGPKSPTVPTAGSQPTTTAASTGGRGSSGQGPLAQAEAYSQCIRSHGVPNFPDPVVTPSGGYGYRTAGINPGSAAFQGALQACKALPSPWHSTGQQLSPAEQQSWLSWAACIRTHGVPNFPDPTFPGGGAVQISGAGASSSQPLQSAMDACKSQLPSVGGLGG
jgi:hypothetical protein